MSDGAASIWAAPKRPPCASSRNAKLRPRQGAVHSTVPHTPSVLSCGAILHRDLSRRAAHALARSCHSQGKRSKAWYLIKLFWGSIFEKIDLCHKACQGTIGVKLFSVKKISL